MATKPEDSVYRLLSTNGDGTGTTNATGDYSGAEGEFYITPSENKKMHITRMLVFIEDTASSFTADNYGGLAGALTNGIRCVCKDQSGNEVLDLTASSPVTSNAGWAQHCHDVRKSEYGSGSDFLSARWTFEKSGAKVYLQRNDRLSILINDNLTGLITHTFLVQGYQE